MCGNSFFIPNPPTISVTLFPFHPIPILIWNLNLIPISPVEQFPIPSHFHSHLATQPRQMSIYEEFFFLRAACRADAQPTVLDKRDGRLSWPWWLIIYWDGLRVYSWWTSAGLIRGVCVFSWYQRLTYYASDSLWCWHTVKKLVQVSCANFLTVSPPLATWNCWLIDW